MLLERIVLPPIREQPPLWDELLRVREQSFVGMLDHGRHAHGRSPRNHPFNLAVLALVDQILIARDPGGPMRESWHQPQGLMDHGPEVGPLLEVGPLEVERVGAFQGVLDSGEGGGLGEEVEGYASKGCLWNHAVSIRIRKKGDRLTAVVSVPATRMLKPSPERR